MCTFSWYLTKTITTTITMTTKKKKKSRRSSNCKNLKQQQQQHEQEHRGKKTQLRKIVERGHQLLAGLLKERKKISSFQCISTVCMMQVGAALRAGVEYRTPLPEHVPHGALVPRDRFLHQLLLQHLHLLQHGFQVPRETVKALFCRGSAAAKSKNTNTELTTAVGGVVSRIRW